MKSFRLGWMVLQNAALSLAPCQSVVSMSRCHFQCNSNKFRFAFFVSHITHPSQSHFNCLLFVDFSCVVFFSLFFVIAINGQPMKCIFNHQHSMGLHKWNVFGCCCSGYTSVIRISIGFSLFFVVCNGKTESLFNWLNLCCTQLCMFHFLSMKYMCKKCEIRRLVWVKRELYVNDANYFRFSQLKSSFLFGRFSSDFFFKLFLNDSVSEKAKLRKIIHWNGSKSMQKLF